MATYHPHPHPPTLAAGQFPDSVQNTPPHVQVPPYPRPPVLIGPPPSLHPFSESAVLRNGPALHPRSRLRTVGDRAFSVAAPTIWNALPAEIRNAASLDIFKSSLKTHLFTMAFGP
ncbi:hypothetical protein OYC64_021177 [Pagothenia borchgrevinki]